MRTTTPTAFGDASPARKRMLRLFQHINNGRIEGLVVKDGEPVFEPPPRIVRTVKFPGDNERRPEIATRDFLLKTQVRELLTYLDQLRNGVIEALEVRGGLPTHMAVEEEALPAATD